MFLWTLQICEFYETMQTFGVCKRHTKNLANNVIEFCIPFIFSVFVVSQFLAGVCSINRKHNGIENIIPIFVVLYGFLSMNLVYGANAKHNGFNFSEYVK